MTEFLLTHKIDASSIQKATALREKVSQVLGEEAEVAVISSSVGQLTQAFEVVGVDTAEKKPFTERVEAKDQHEAEEKVATKTKVVAEVRPA